MFPFVDTKQAFDIWHELEIGSLFCDESFTLKQNDGSRQSPIYLYPRLCSRRRSETQKTSAKRAVGGILHRRHSNNYVEGQNRETSFAARIFKSQQMATAQSGFKLAL